jgi:outer membrane receptor for ferrienterochelin and colicins
MTSAFSHKQLPLALCMAAALLTLSSNLAVAQDQPTTGDDSTVTYPASYFDQYDPFSVNDMLDRIPGISVARGNGGGNNQGGPGSSGGSNRRGLGAGGDQILINGRRIAGKDNQGNSQLSRIPANQLNYIEIIRGTSGDLDVRGGNQVINIVLLEAETRNSFAYELNVDHLQDGTFQPGAKISLTGQNGPLEYLLSAEREPRWQFRDGAEFSVHPDGGPNDTIDRNEITDSWPITLAANFGYQISDQDTAHLNLQLEDKDAPGKIDRKITDFNSTPPQITIEREDIPSTSEAWEIGGDYEHLFNNGNRFKTLFIINEGKDDTTRERFEIDGATRTKDLYLANFNRNQERIIRSSYTMGLTGSQDVEFGVERAQTILDTSLQLGLATGEPISPVFGNLAPISNANGTVEEIRYEYFAIHNWQLNNRMSLESTLLLENSEISQTGDISKSRDFDFVRPKLDYRFDITPSLQLRASIEKDVAQLSFFDFTANIDGADDDQNEVAGNPDLRQEQSWRYEANLEYRLPNDAGVISSNLFYHELEDVIEKVDVSTATNILSANGNIGDGERYGVNLDSSLRLGMLNQPDMLITGSLGFEESSVNDPFLNKDRSLGRRGNGRYSFGFRHDIPSRNMNWGFSFNSNFDGDTYSYDIDKIEEYPQGGFSRIFFETQGWGNLTYRFESMDTGDRCRIRSRYINGTIATGQLSEIEDSCSSTGLKMAIKVRGTF